MKREVDEDEWASPPRPPRLANGEVHVWLASLTQPAAQVAELRELLDADERGRADRFHFEKDRGRFVVARALLRRLLGLYLNARPAELSFAYGAFGKPELRGEAGAPPALRFNLAHSHELALYAFARGREVGVDLEHVRPDLAGEEIAERFFSAREVAALRSLAPEARAEGFFNCWTRKEAYIKALGEGLSHPLDSFTVSLRPGEPAALLEVEGDEAEAARWSLRELRPAPGYVAALVAERDDWSLRCFRRE